MDTYLWCTVLILLSQSFIISGMNFELNFNLGDSGNRVMTLRTAETQAAKKTRSKRAYGRWRTAYPVEARLFSFLNSTSYVKATGYSALTQLYKIKDIQKRTKLHGKELFNFIKRKLRRDSLLPSCGFDIKSDSQLPVPKRYDCCAFPRIRCKKTDRKYRTLDGSCNCISKPHMGRANRAYKRIIPPDYADGISEPRVAKSGNPLPSARKISNELHRGSHSQPKSKVLTMMHMTFGQMVDHDTDMTPVSMLLSENGTLIDMNCGSDGCDTSGDDKKECFPIIIPADDPSFKYKECLTLVRSQALMKDGCKIGPREQANVITTWLDVSHMYGSSKKENMQLRDPNPSRGKMKTIPHPANPKCKPLIPNKFDKFCKGTYGYVQCFHAGDTRQNYHAALMAMHIIFVRVHNHIEENLHCVNPHWDGEKLFQETRKIVAAVWQNMIYQEYLPPILGPKFMDRYGLNIGKKGCYKEYSCKRANGDIANVFAAAAFRMGHSQVGDFIRLTDSTLTKKKDLTFQQVFSRPHTVYETHFGNTCGVAALMLGQAVHFADEIDRLFSPSVQKHLFTETPPHGLGTDLPSLNTQRGRDHGLPGYNYWRKWCGLSVASSFRTLHDIPYADRLIFERLYEDVNDIDLFTGGIAEEHVSGGIVGPTFACVLAEQFRNLKMADRFWFENCGTSGFTMAQIDNIRQYTTGRFLCDTLDDVKKIQKFTMMKSKREVLRNLGCHASEVYHIASLYKGIQNEPEPCSQHTGIDFELWRDKRRPYGSKRRRRRSRGKL